MRERGQTDAPGAPVDAGRPAPRRWRIELAVIGALALTVRVVYVLGWKHPVFIGGDAYWYHYGAQLLVNGHGFIDAYRYKIGIVAGTADHPPVTILFLAFCDLFGMRSFFWQQLDMCVVGSCTVVLIAAIARQLAGRRAGLFAGVVAAVYPNLWINDAMVMSETLIQVTTALAVLAAYRWWARPTRGRAAALGVAVAVCALTRAEAVLFVPLLTAPLILFDRRHAVRERVRQVVLSALVAGLVLAPWVGYNLVRFNEPVTISTGFDPTAAVSNCNKVYYGPLTGYWWRPCILSDPVPPKNLDVPAQEAFYRRIAIKYMKAHESRVPVVVVARMARTWALFHPVQQIRLDQIETRELYFSGVGLGMYYVLGIATLAGVWIMRRRRVPVSPILATIGTVTFATAITFGQTRYRAAAEVVLVLGAAMTFAALRAHWLGPDPDGGPLLRAGSLPPAPPIDVDRSDIAPEAVDTDQPAPARDPAEARLEPSSPGAANLEAANLEPAAPPAGIEATNVDARVEPAGNEPALTRAGAKAAGVDAANIRAANIRAANIDAANIDAAAVEADKVVPATHRSFPCLDGMRAIAAVTVIIVHTAFPSGFSTQNHRWGAFTARMEIGVAVFFLISGFLLYRPFVAAHLSGRPSPDVRTYLKRRLLRIVPAYWVALFFAAYVFHTVTMPINNAKAVIVYFGFLQIYSSHYILHGISAAWTLCVEMSFYLFLPLYAAGIARWARRSGRDILRAEAGGVIGLFVISIVYKCVIFARPTTQQTGAGTWLPAQLDLFAIGMGLAIASVWWAEHRSEPALLSRRLMPALSWTAALVCFWGVSEAGLPRVPIYLESVGQILTRQELYGAFAFFLILPAVFGPQHEGAIRRLLRSRPLVLTGVVSYGIYLWHETWMLEVLKWVHQPLFTTSFLTLTLDVSVLAGATAAASYVLIEQPFQRLGRRRPPDPAAPRMAPLEALRVPARG